MDLNPDLVPQFLTKTRGGTAGGRRTNSYLLAGILSFAAGEAYVGNAHAERIAAELSQISREIVTLREYMAGATVRADEHDRRLERVEREHGRRIEALERSIRGN